MVNFFIMDLAIRKKVYIIMFVVLVLVTSTANTVLVYFYQNVNVEKNKYYNIYSIQVSHIENHKIAKMMDEIDRKMKYDMKGNFRVGKMMVNGVSCNCACYMFKNVSRFYSTLSGNVAADGTIVASSSIPEEVLMKMKYKHIEISNLIYSCDLQEHIDFVYSLHDYERNSIDTNKVGIEFTEHLNFFQLHQLKKIVEKYSTKAIISHESAFSLYAVNNVKNVFTVLLCLFIYTCISIMGILDYMLKTKKRMLQICIIFGMKKISLQKIMFLVVLGLEFVAFLFSYIGSNVLCMKLNLHRNGFFRWLPYFITSFIIIFISFLIMYCHIKKTFQEDIILSKE